MLVLSRQPGQEIVIDGCIRITVVSIKGKGVRIGIDAPANVVINRQEVQQRYLEFAEKIATPEPCPI